MCVKKMKMSQQISCQMSNRNHTDYHRITVPINDIPNLQLEYLTAFRRQDSWSVNRKNCPWLRCTSSHAAVCTLNTQIESFHLLALCQPPQALLFPGKGLISPLWQKASEMCLLINGTGYRLNLLYVCEITDFCF